MPKHDTKTLRRAYDILRKGRDIIADPKRFRRGEVGSNYHRLSDGDLRVAKDAHVCSWGALMLGADCTIGQSGYRGHGERTRPEMACASSLLGKAMGGHIVQFNDDKSNSHQDIVKRWDLAIENAGKVLDAAERENKQSDAV